MMHLYSRSLWTKVLLLLVVVSLASGLSVWAAPTTTDVPIDRLCKQADKVQPNSDFKGCCGDYKVQPNSDYKGGCCGDSGKVQPNTDYKGGCCGSYKVEPNSDYKGGCCGSYKVDSSIDGKGGGCCEGSSKIATDADHHDSGSCCPSDPGKIASVSIDHHKGDTSCPPPTPAPADNTCDLDESGVVGRLFNDQQAYYEPGNVSPEVVLPAGTYIVDGIATDEDNGDQYYRIVYSCQYLYVPLDTMGPNYDPPQNGEPLPTTPVE